MLSASMNGLILRNCSELLFAVYICFSRHISMILRISLLVLILECIVGLSKVGDYPLRLSKKNNNVDDRLTNVHSLID